MREIVFRGKPLEKSEYEWVYGYLFKSWEKVYILWGTTNGIPNMTRVIPETVGQDIGMSDVESNDVFEGDVIEYRLGGSRYTIVYREDLGRFMLKLQNGESMITFADARDWNNTQLFRVVGNIHS